MSILDVWLLMSSRYLRQHSTASTRWSCDFVGGCHMTAVPGIIRWQPVINRDTWYNLSANFLNCCHVTTNKVRWPPRASSQRSDEDIESSVTDINGSERHLYIRDLQRYLYISCYEFNGIWHQYTSCELESATHGGEKVSSELVRS